MLPALPVQALQGRAKIGVGTNHKVKSGLGLFGFYILLPEHTGHADKHNRDRDDFHIFFYWYNTNLSPRSGFRLMLLVNAKC